MFDSLSFAPREGAFALFHWDVADAVPIAHGRPVDGRRTYLVRNLAPVGRRPPDEEAAPEIPPEDDPDNSDLDDFPFVDDSHWDAFVPDDDERDPEPEPGDFWTDMNDEERQKGSSFTSFVILSFVILALDIPSFVISW